MGYDDEFCGLSVKGQKICLGCSCCGAFAGLITFIILITNRRTLGPGQQILVRLGRWDRTGYNGPGTFQLAPFKGTEMREALRLGASQYASLRHIRTMRYVAKEGPCFEFIDPMYDLHRIGQKTRLTANEYIRVINARTGSERISRGPATFTPNVTEQGHNSTAVLAFVEGADMLTSDVALVIRDKLTGELSLATACNTPLGPVFPTPTQDVIETRRRIFIGPHEAVLLRDIDGQSTLITGMTPMTEVPGICDDDIPEQSAGGLAFFLPPLTRIVRMRWSDYSRPQESALNFTALRTPTAVSARRRRSSRSRVVREHQFSSRPRTWLVGGDFNKVENLWVNRGSGPNISRLVRAGAVTVHSTGPNAPTAQLTALLGASSTTLEFGNLIPGNAWTICSLTRYTGGAKNVVLGGPSNWAFGHYRGHAGVAWYGTNFTQSSRDAVRPDTEWVGMCGKSSGQADELAWIFEERVGRPVTRGSIRSPRRPARVYVNGDTRKSDFAIAEVVVWNKALPNSEILEVAQYFRDRLHDAASYVDQVDESEQVPSGITRNDVIKIDMRAQKSFYKFQVRTNDNVRLVIEGTIFWQIVDVPKMISATSDPEGDAWAKSRSVMLGAVSDMTWSEFLADFNQVVERAYASQQSDTFWGERGLRLISMEITGYVPLDQRTIDSLRRIVESKVDRITRLTRQRSDSDVRATRIAADIALEDNRTSLIEAQTLNARMQAETRGATEGGKKARGISVFLKNVGQAISGEAVQPVQLYEENLRLRSLENQTQKLFNGQARVFLKPNATNVTLTLPHDTPRAPPRRLNKPSQSPATGLPAAGASMAPVAASGAAGAASAAAHVLEL